MYYKQTITAGQTIEVYKYYVKRERRGQRGEKARPTPEEIERVNQLNAERNLRIKINANFGEDDLFVTLTYKREERPSPEAAKKNIKKWIDNVRKEYKELGSELKYINVTEYKNKAIHHHIIINHIPGQDSAKIVRKHWQFGRPDFKFLDSSGQYKDLASYLIKETSETFKTKDGGHKQRYSCSRNLVMPEPKTEIIKRATRWTNNPQPKKGYYIDQETIWNGIDFFTGTEYQRYTMIKLKTYQQGCG